jgi:hypothetical protein
MSDEAREQVVVERGVFYANEAKGYSIHNEPMDEKTGQYHDNEAKKGLETAHNGTPDWCMNHEDSAILAGCRGIARRAVLCHSSFGFSFNVFC